MTNILLMIFYRYHNVTDIDRSMVMIVMLNLLTMPCCIVVSVCNGVFIGTLISITFFVDDGKSTQTNKFISVMTH